MSDVLVRVPRDQREHVLADKCDPERRWAYWRLAHWPRRVEPGELIHLQCGAHIIASAPVENIERADDGVRVYWSPERAQIHCPAAEGVRGGWRGFRYVEGLVNYEEPRPPRQPIVRTDEELLEHTLQEVFGG